MIAGDFLFVKQKPHGGKTGARRGEFEKENIFMDYTQNLHLPQWEKTDRIMMDDFNDAMSKIDAAMPRIVTGSYTGDGTTNGSHVIDLGFRPKVVIVANGDGILNSTAGTFGGIALDGSNAPAVGISETGFFVPVNPYTKSNENGTSYRYIAIG